MSEKFVKVDIFTDIETTITEIDLYHTGQIMYSVNTKIVNVENFIKLVTEKQLELCKTINLRVVLLSENMVAVNYHDLYN